MKLPFSEEEEMRCHRADNIINDTDVMRKYKLKHSDLERGEVLCKSVSHIILLIFWWAFTPLNGIK